MPLIEHSFKAMGGPCRLRLDVQNESDADEAIVAAEAEVRRLEEKYSRYLPESLTSEINRRAGTGKATAIDPETHRLLDYADTLWRESLGLFDLTSGILRKAWDFKSGKLPRQTELDALLPMVDWRRVEWSERSVLLQDTAMELDFGGCVKEYACDCTANILAQHGISHGLVDLAGDMTACGPRRDDSPWRIGIRNPDTHESAIAEMALAAGGLASSGTYERYLQIGGKRYGHVLNPKTGWPIEGLVAVSVVAPQCLVAGSIATLALLKPTDQALPWLDSVGLPWLAVDAERRVHNQAVSLSSRPR